MSFFHALLLSFLCMLSISKNCSSMRFFTVENDGKCCFLQKYSILCMGKMIYYFYCFVIKYIMDMIFILQPICVVLIQSLLFLFYSLRFFILGALSEGYARRARTMRENKGFFGGFRSIGV